MTVSPTQRTLKELRKRGFLADVVERWIPRANIRKDLFGFIDLVALDGNRLLAIQATTGAHHAARRTKILEHDNYELVRKSPFEIWLWTWRKNAKGRWILREELLG